MSAHYKVTEHANESGIFYYILETEKDYVFRDKRQPPQIDEAGAEEYDYTTAIGLLPEEYEQVDEIVEVTERTENMKIH